MLFKSLAYISSIPNHLEVNVGKALITLPAHASLRQAVYAFLEVGVLGRHVELLRCHHKLLPLLSLIDGFLKLRVPLLHVLVKEHGRSICIIAFAR